jgi:hypothetical protein
MKLFAVLIALFFSGFSVAQCVAPNPDGSLLFTADTVQSCSGYWLIPASEYSAYLSVVEINAADYSTAFLWGFGVVIMFSGLAYPVAIAKRLIGKI